MQLFKNFIDSGMVKKITVYEDFPAEFVLKNGVTGKVVLTEDPLIGNSALFQAVQ